MFFGSYLSGSIGVLDFGDMLYTYTHEPQPGLFSEKCIASQEGHSYWLADRYRFDRYCMSNVLARCSDAARVKKRATVKSSKASKKKAHISKAKRLNSVE